MPGGDFASGGLTCGATGVAGGGAKPSSPAAGKPGQPRVPSPGLRQRLASVKISRYNDSKDKFYIIIKEAQK